MSGPTVALCRLEQRRRRSRCYRLRMQPQAIAVMPPPDGSQPVPENHPSSNAPQAVQVKVLNASAVGPVDLDADARWLAWKTRGAAADRRTSIRMGRLFAIVVVVVVGWLSLQAW